MSSENKDIAYYEAWTRKGEPHCTGDRCLLTVLPETAYLMGSLMQLPSSRILYFCEGGLRQRRNDGGGLPTIRESSVRVESPGTYVTE